LPIPQAANSAENLDAAQEGLTGFNPWQHFDKNFPLIFIENLQ